MEDKMIREKEEVHSQVKPSPFDGKGNIKVRDLLNAPEEMYDKGRVFAHTTVYPGSSIGYHVHRNESETYYILSGSGKFNDNGTIVDVHPGAVYYTPDGHGHGIEATGEEPIELIALILYK
jgi:mannose-6-phosphate isomerase-like protein (cupin superfamily)